MIFLRSLDKFARIVILDYGPFSPNYQIFFAPSEEEEKGVSKLKNTELDFNRISNFATTYLNGIG